MIGFLSHNNPLRLFFAIELSAEARGHVAEHIARLQENESGRGARWNRVENLHITLKFLGEAPAARVENIACGARKVAREFAPFELSVSGAGSFPPRGAARVLWLGIEDENGRLAALQRRLEDELVGEGFAREGREFNPHLTIARTNRMSAGDSRRLAQLHAEKDFAASFEAHEFVIMRSELGANGSRYTPLHHFAFRTRVADLSLEA